MLLAGLLLVITAQACAQFPGADLQNAVDKAIASDAPYVTVPSGTYYFNKSSFVIADAHTFSVFAADVTLIFYPGYGVLITNSKNSLIQGPLTVDYDPPCFTQGVIVAVNTTATTMDLKIDDGFPAPSIDYFASGEIKLQYYTNDTSRLRVRAQAPSNPVRIGQEVSSGVFRIQMLSGWGLRGAVPQPGMLVSVSPRIGASQYEVPDWYKGQAYTVFSSSHIVSEEVTLLGSGNFAVTEWGGEGGHVYSRNCDGFHSFSTGTGATIINSEIRWMGDDALNFHNRVGIVLSSQGFTFTFVDVGDIPAPGQPASNPARAFADLRSGDTLRLFHSYTLLGQINVTSVSAVTDPNVLAAARKLAGTLGASVNPDAVAAWTVSYTFGGGPLTLASKDVVQFDKRSSNSAQVISTVFSDAYDSCARLQSSDSIITGCTFTRAYSGMSIVYDPSWLEGSIGSFNVTVSNNVFTEIGFPSITKMSDLISADADVRNLQIINNTLLP